MVTLTEITTVWNNFFFSPEPVHTIALFRLLLGGILLYNAFFFMLDAKDFFHPNGMYDYNRFMRKSIKKRFSIFQYLPATMASVNWVLGIHLLSVILLTLGLFTTYSAIAVFLTLVSLSNRNPFLNNGGDTVLRMMCFFLIFTPCGHTFSLDEYFFYSSSEDSSYLWQSPWAVRLMQIQLAIIYLRTVFWKLKGETWQDGTAFFYAIRIKQYQRYALPAFCSKAPFLQMSTWGALALEVGLGTAIWIDEFRYPMIIAGILFHLAIEFSMVLHIFSWIMMASLLLFINPEDLMYIFNESCDVAMCFGLKI